MNQKLERIIALYGSPREGKSSTLRELIKLMTGSLPSGVKHDYRVIIKDYYVQKEDKHVNVFIATCGDTKDVILKSIFFSMVSCIQNMQLRYGFLITGAKHGRK